MSSNDYFNFYPDLSEDALDYVGESTETDDEGEDIAFEDISLEMPESEEDAEDIYND